MKNKNVINVANQITSLRGLKSSKFSYGIVKNIKLLQDEMDTLNKSKSEKFREYEEKQTEIAMKYADKDKNKNPIMEGRGYKITKNIGIVDSEIKKLKPKYKKEIEEWEKLMEEENKTEWYEINLEDVPEEISVGQMSIVEEFIVDNNQKKA